MDAGDEPSPAASPPPVGETTGDRALTCPVCASPSARGERFCEACGAELATGRPRRASSLPRRRRRTTEPEVATTPTTCRECGGEVGADGYCTSAGPRRRARATTSPSSRPPGSAAVCDRGVRHTRNEDAVALRRRVRARQPRGARGVRRRLLLDRLRRRQPRGGPRRPRRAGRSRPPGRGHRRRPGRRDAPGPSTRPRTRPTRPSSPTPTAGPGQPGVVHVRRRVVRRAAARGRAGSATAAPTGCPTRATHCC